MQITAAEKLRQKWLKEHAGEICTHPNLDREYDLGSSTGDYVCTVCGESGPGRDWPEKERNLTT